MNPDFSSYRVLALVKSSVKAQYVIASFISQGTHKVLSIYISKGIRIKKKVCFSGLVVHFKDLSRYFGT